MCLQNGFLCKLTYIRRHFLSLLDSSILHFSYLWLRVAEHQVMAECVAADSVEGIYTLYLKEHLTIAIIPPKSHKGTRRSTHDKTSMRQLVGLHIRDLDAFSQSVL